MGNLSKFNEERNFAKEEWFEPDAEDSLVTLMKISGVHSPTQTTPKQRRPKRKVPHDPSMPVIESLKDRGYASISGQSGDFWNESFELRDPADLSHTVDLEDEPNSQGQSSQTRLTSNQNQAGRAGPRAKRFTSGSASPKRVKKKAKKVEV